MPALIIQSGKHRGKRLKLPKGGKQIVVGRDESCHVRLTTEEVSRMHCVIKATAQGLLVGDLGSRNGTQVNGVTIAEETLLNDGDRLQVGPVLFEVTGSKKLSRSESDAQAHAMPSENDVLSWLTDEVPTTRSKGDTTVVKTPDESQRENEASSAPDDVSSAPENAPDPQRPVPAAAESSSPPERIFETIAEEADDIIRRHKQMVEQSRQAQNGESRPQP